MEEQEIRNKIEVHLIKCKAQEKNMATTFIICLVFFAAGFLTQIPIFLYGSAAFFIILYYFYYQYVIEDSEIRDLRIDLCLKLVDKLEEDK